MTNDPTIPTKAEIEDLAQWAEAGEFDPNFAGGEALHGAAAAAGRALLEAAGVDVDAVERADSLDVVQFGAADPEISTVWIDPEIEPTEREGSNTPAAHRFRAPPERSGGALELSSRIHRAECDDAIVKMMRAGQHRPHSADFELAHEHVVFVFEDVAVEHVDPSEVRELGSHGHAAP